MPTTQEETFRFTDISPILKAPVKKANTTVAVEDSAIDGLLLEEDSRNRVIILNGVLQWKVTTLDDDLKKCIQDTNQRTTSLDLLVRRNRSRLTKKKDWFSTGCSVVGERRSICEAEWCTVYGRPLSRHSQRYPDRTASTHCLSLVRSHSCAERRWMSVISLGDGEDFHVSAPRLFIKCRNGSRLEVVEEFVMLDGTSGAHLSLPVCEIELDENAELFHHYVQLDGPSGYHMKTTLVRQSTKSNYHLVESTIGGQLSRHDLDIEQVGWSMKVPSLM